MTAPLDEARLRELAEWHQERADEAFRREAAHDEADAPSSAAAAHQDWQFDRDAAATILALLDALSAERERVADMQRRLDLWEPKTTSGSSIAVSSRIGGNNAPLATQKAEGVE